MANWIKKGKAVVEATEQEAVKSAAREAASSRPWRFRLKDGEDAIITFLDGDLNEEGLIDCVAYYEHQVQEGTNYPQYVCLNDPENGVSCPICESENTPYLAYALTIIDHREYTDRNNVAHTHTRRPFIFKKATYSLLQKIATKRGGLAGARFEVSRDGQMSPAVGNMFDFDEKITKLKLKKEFGDDAQPFDYEEVLPIQEEESLRSMGYGMNAVGSVKPAASGNKSDKDYADEL